MKLMRRESRNPAILERELELEREYKANWGRDISVRLCNTRVRHAFESTKRDLGALKDTDPLYFQMVMHPIIRLVWGLVGPIINYVDAYGTSKCSRDPITGKYILENDY